MRRHWSRILGGSMLGGPLGGFLVWCAISNPVEFGKIAISLAIAIAAAIYLWFAIYLMVR